MAAAAAAATACDKGTSTKQALPTPSRRPNVVLFFPDQEAVTRIPSLNRNNIDIVPTILDLTGVNWPTPLPGQSLRDVLTKDPSQYRDDVFVESNFPEAQSMQPGPTHMLRTKDWKYVVYQSGYEQLFDENADPGETRNLAGNPEQASVMREMRDRLNAWLEMTKGASLLGS